MVFLASSGFTKAISFFLLHYISWRQHVFFSITPHSYSWLLQATGCIPEPSKDLSNTSELPIIIPLTHEFLNHFAFYRIQKNGRLYTSELVCLSATCQQCDLGKLLNLPVPQFPHLSKFQSVHGLTLQVIITPPPQLLWD